MERKEHIMNGPGTVTRHEGRANNGIRGNMKVSVGKMPRCFGLSIYGWKKRIIIRIFKYYIELIKV